MITGGTTGKGLATAKLFINEGARVIVAGRSLCRLQETAVEPAVEAKKKVFAPLELDLNASASVN